MSRLPPLLQAYDKLFYGNIDGFRRIMDDAHFTLSDFDSSQLTRSSMASGSLPVMVELLEMDVAPRSDVPYIDLNLMVQERRYEYHFTTKSILNRLKFMLFLMAQPGSPVVEMNDKMREYLSDARLRPGLVKVLAEINKYVDLVSPQALPIREYLARAGLNVPELIAEVMGRIAFNRRKHLVALRRSLISAPPPEGGGGGGAANNNMTYNGGRRRRRTIRKSKRTHRR